MRGREVLVIGAGNAGELIVREMVKGRSGYTLIGILDDDPAKQVFRLHGVKVLGTIDRLDRILRDTRLDEVVIAMPSASGARRQTVVDACRANGVPVRTLPGPEELLGADSLVTRLREVRVEDLLGREPVRVDLEQVGRLRGRSRRPRHRRRRLDRLGAGAPDQPARPGPAGAGRQRRDEPVHDHARARRPPRRRASCRCWPTSRTRPGCARCSATRRRTSCSTRPRTSTCR